MNLRQEFIRIRQGREDDREAVVSGAISLLYLNIDFSLDNSKLSRSYHNFREDQERLRENQHFIGAFGG